MNIFSHRFEIYKYFTVAEMTFDSYEPVARIGNTVYAKSAVFDATGDISVFTTGRRRGGHDHHHGYDFHGSGGCLSYSSTHNSGFMSSPPSGVLSSSHSANSAFGNPSAGYSYTANIMFGYDHDHHHHTHYMYTTHGDHHHHPGSSLRYHDHKLQMDVHEHHTTHDSHHHHHHNEDHHYKLSCPFYPIHGQTYSITSSYRSVLLQQNLMFLNNIGV